MTIAIEKPKRETKALPANAWTLTNHLRWLKTGNSKVLQQEWRNAFTAQTEWRDVEIVTQDKSE